MSVPAPRFGSVRLLMDRHFARNEEQLSNTEYQAYDIPSELKVSVQLFIQGGDFDRFSEFVEALKADPRLVAAYNTLKREWDGRPMNGYREAKAHFISAVLRNAATL